MAVEAQTADKDRAELQGKLKTHKGTLVRYKTQLVRGVPWTSRPAQTVYPDLRNPFAPLPPCPENPLQRCRSRRLALRALWEQVEPYRARPRRRPGGFARPRVTDGGAAIATPLSHGQARRRAETARRESPGRAADGRCRFDHLARPARTARRARAHAGHGQFTPPSPPSREERTCRRRPADGVLAPVAVRRRWIHRSRRGNSAQDGTKVSRKGRTR